MRRQTEAGYARFGLRPGDHVPYGLCHRINNPAPVNYRYLTKFVEKPIKAKVANRKRLTTYSYLRIVDQRRFRDHKHYLRLSNDKLGYLIGNTVFGLIFINDGYHVRRMCIELMAQHRFFSHPYSNGVKSVLLTAKRLLAPDRDDHVSPSFGRHVHAFLRCQSKLTCHTHTVSARDAGTHFPKRLVTKDRMLRHRSAMATRRSPSPSDSPDWGEEEYF